MDVVDVIQAPRLPTNMGGEALFEEHAEDVYLDDDTTSDEGDSHLPLLHEQEMVDVGDEVAPGDGQAYFASEPGDLSAPDGGHRPVGAERAGAGAAGGDDDGVMSANLKIEISPLAEISVGSLRDMGEMPSASSSLGRGPGLQAIAMEAAESGRISPSVAGGMLDTGRASPLTKTWGQHYTGEAHRDGAGAAVAGSGRERSSTASSSSSDESMGGHARLSAPAMKQQWEEAMSGIDTPETPHRSHRGSTSVDGGSVGRGSGFLLSPAARALANVFGSSDGVVNRSGRSGSVGGSIGVAATSASVLGAHLRRYGWVADGDVTECMNACGTEFSIWERRHHCRCCGGVFCEDCSGHRCLVPDPVMPPDREPLDPTRPHRVCNSCYRDVQPSQEDLLAKVSKARRPNLYSTSSPARHCNPPFGLDLAHEVRKAANTLNNVLARRRGCDCEGINLMGGTERRISNSLCEGARGLVFVTVAKAGFLYAAEAGTGLCVVRLGNGEWSAPAAVGTFGVSWGLQAGCEVVDVVIPLRSDAAVEMLKCGGQVYVELDAAIAVGPVGRSVASAVGGRAWPGEEGTLDLAARYSLCKGLFAGVGVGAGFLRIMNSVNERFYGAQVSSRNILSGLMPRPPAAIPLYASLSRLERSIRKGLPRADR